jgi:hypothetical protein
MKKLVKLQNELKVPKSKRNDFAGFDYRSAEDILKAIKPLCEKHNLYLNLTDEFLDSGTYPIIKSIATIYDLDDVSIGEEITFNSRVSSVGYAAVDVSRKKVTVDQCFGAASSFARKYALNGLLLIDDSASDPDNPKMQRSAAPQSRKTTTVEKKAGDKKKVVAGTAEYNKLLEWIQTPKGSIEKALEMYDIDKATENIIRKSINQ